MSSQLEDHFNAAVEAVARLLYARKRTPREPKWGETDPEVRRCCVRDARAVIDLWLKVSAPCLWCAGTGRTADGYPCSVCGGTGLVVVDDDTKEER